MNGKQYNNIINWTLNHNPNVDNTDSLGTVRSICNNMGVALPHGNCNQVANILKTNDYMGWRSCTFEEACSSANNGVATVGISEDRIVMVATEKNLSDISNFKRRKYSDVIMVITEQESTQVVNNLEFYVYTAVSTTQNYSNMLIYRSRNRERLGFLDASVDTDVTPITNEDLTYGQKDTYTICHNGSLVSNSDLYSSGFTTQYTIQQRVNIIERFFYEQIDNNSVFTSILSEMIDHFIDGSGSDYSNVHLTNAVKNHTLTQNFVNKAVDLIKQCIVNCNGNIRALWYDEDLWIRPIIRKKHPIVKSFLDEKLFLPSYNQDNGVPGLTLAIHTWHGNKIEILSFNTIGTTYSGRLRFTFYDHFGLDTEDLSSKKYGNMYAGYISAFRQWYILQHWSELNAPVQPKPFVTKVSFVVSFNGSL